MFGLWDSFKYEEALAPPKRLATLSSGDEGGEQGSGGSGSGSKKASEESYNSANDKYNYSMRRVLKVAEVRTVVELNREGVKPERVVSG